MSIAGTYRLFKYGYTSKHDAGFKPVSDWSGGVIHYSETGFMSVTLRFAEKPEEFADVVAYCGRYKVEGNKIRHDVTMSVRPEYEGQKLDREFMLKDDVLELIFEDTPEFRKTALWRRES